MLVRISRAMLVYISHAMLVRRALEYTALHEKNSLANAIFTNLERFGF